MDIRLVPELDLEVLRKWKQAVVHLEGATSSVDFVSRWRELTDRLQKGEISVEQMMKEEIEDFAKGNRDIRFQGTATFLEHNEHYFLLTARHVLFDELGAERRVQEMKKFHANWPPEMQERLNAEEIERAKDTIFGIIFVVPTFDEVIQGKAQSPERFLMNLGAGVTWMSPYTFSEPSLDLAVVSLTNRFLGVAEELLARGFRPVKLDDLAYGPSREGVEVFSVGYPGHMSLIGQRPLQLAEQAWASQSYSLPSFAFGRVSMVHDRLPFFWCDLGAYPGHSGAPVVEEGKMIGVISAQGTSYADVFLKKGEHGTGREQILLDTDFVAKTRIPFGRAFRTKLLRDLLDVQMEKDRNRDEARHPPPSPDQLPDE
jgi:hypothetical protein